MTRLKMTFSDRTHGSMQFGSFETADVLNNRLKMFSDFLEYGSLALGFSPDLVHGDRVIGIDADKSDRFDGSGIIEEVPSIECDGVVTDALNFPIFFLSADCFLIAIFDSRKSALGIFHSGRRGTILNIAGKTVRAMRECFGSRPENIAAHFLPGICPDCYQIEYLPEDFPREYQNFAPKRNGVFSLNLKGIILHQLLEADVEKVFFPLGRNECTCCTPGQNGEPKYFSHFGFKKKLFGHKTPGRNALLVKMIW